MNVVGIECTAHTLAIGVCDDRKIRSNVIDTYFGGDEGFIPRKLADHHASVFANVLSRSLEEAKLTLPEIDLISFSQGPGIGSPLSVGITGSRYLAARFSKPLVGVNHPFAHVKISEHFCKLRSPLILYLSGGNSQILIEDNHGFYDVLGETLDMGVGNMFDSFAREIKLPNPHGSTLEKFAKGGNYIELPYSVKGMNLVFSGLQTAAEKVAKSHSSRDVAYSLMETAFSMICEVTERAIFLTKKTNLVVCGGVAQNRRLQEMLRLMCQEVEIKFGVAPDEYNRDNGAMIAYAGLLLYKKFGPMALDRAVPITNYRIDRMKEVFLVE